MNSASPAVAACGQRSCNLDAAPLIAALFPGDRDDPLLVGESVKPPLSATIDLPAVAASVGSGRRFLAEVLDGWDCGHRTDDAQLLLSELLTNGIQYAEGPLNVRLVRTDTGVTVEVQDGNTEVPQPRLADTGEESGRGFMLIEFLADQWGVRVFDRGKIVWFSMSIPDSSAAVIAY